MRATLTKRPAFTFIELLIVIIIMAILSVALAISYQRVQLKVRYDAHVNAIVELFQRARSLSLSTLMIDDTEPVEFYYLAVGEGDVVLTAEGGGLSEELDRFTFDNDIMIDTELEIYYFPPYGDICLGASGCNDPIFVGPPETENVTVLSDASGVYSTEFTITNVGGYVDAVQLTP